MKRFPVVLALALGGCAHSGPAPTPAERLASYSAQAGASVDSFGISRIAGVARWTPLDDSALALWNGPGQGYLLGFDTGCPGLSLAASITISNAQGLVNVRLDSVQPRAANGSAISQPCRISSALPLGGPALGAARRELREAGVVDRPEGVTEAGS